MVVSAVNSLLINLLVNLLIVLAASLMLLLASTVAGFAKADTLQGSKLPEPKVVSINVCTDQLVMLLAEPAQILALSALSQDKAGSYFHEQARRYDQVEPIAEQILPLAPDIVVTGPYTPRYTISLLDELGIRHESLPIANDLDQMLANVQRVGELLSQQRKATAIVNEVNARLALIAERVSQLDENSKPTIAIYDPNGYTVGDQTLRGQLINLSGWQNVAATQDIDAYGVLDLEQLIGLRPQALMESPYSENTYSRGQMLAKHPAIRASGLNPRDYQGAQQPDNLRWPVGGGCHRAVIEYLHAATATTLVVSSTHASICARISVIFEFRGD